MVPGGKSAVIDDELDKRRMCTGSASASICRLAFRTRHDGEGKSLGGDLKMLVNGWDLA